MKLYLYIVTVIFAVVIIVAYADRPVKDKGTMNSYSITKFGAKVLDPADPNALSAYPKTTFGAGCYWGTEHVYRQLDGVLATAVGFMGGRVDNPSYKRVCMGDTNHAEVVRLFYDPNQVSFDQLLDVFFEIHNPTLKNRQGNDIGTQYRSAVFYEDDEQKKSVLIKKGELNKSQKYPRPVVTEIAPAKDFWFAEEYHQRYLEKNPRGYCHIPNTLIKEVVEETNKE